MIVLHTYIRTYYYCRPEAIDVLEQINNQMLSLKIETLEASSGSYFDDEVNGLLVSHLTAINHIMWLYTLELTKLSQIPNYSSTFS